MILRAKNIIVEQARAAVATKAKFCETAATIHKQGTSFSGNNI
jgi:hypothetical protein